jgi:hypothetical protein
MAIVIAGWLAIHGRQSFTAAIACDVHRRSKLSQQDGGSEWGERGKEKKDIHWRFGRRGLLLNFLLCS